MKLSMHCAALFVIAGACLVSEAAAGPRVDVVVGASAPKLERFASDELAGQFKRLFDADVRIGDAIPPAADKGEADAVLILLGSPATNPAIKALGAAFPKLSDQGHTLKSVKAGQRPALLVGGGSPVATLWGVYELGQRFGVRYMLFGDLFPATAPALKLDGFDALLEPSLRLRTWETLGDSPIGPAAWGLEEQQHLIRQLAKLKFNRVLLSVHSGQPFLDYEFKGGHKQTAVLWQGRRFPVDGDTAGRGVFRGAKFFANPDFAGKETTQDRSVAGIGLARGIINTAHDLGMTVGLEIAPLELPKDSEVELPRENDLFVSTRTGEAKQPPHEPAVVESAKALIRAYLGTFEDVDALYLRVPVYWNWAGHYEAAATRALRQGTLKELPKGEELKAAFAENPNGADSDRQSANQQAFQAGFVGIEFLGRVLSDPELLKRPQGRRVDAVITDVPPYLLPLLGKVSPGTAVMVFAGKSPNELAARKSHLNKVAANSISSSLIIPLAENESAILPRMEYASLHGLANELRTRGWSGFSIRNVMSGDADLEAYFLSRAAFDASITPQQACDDLLTPICGVAVAKSVFKGFGMVEEAMPLLNRHAHGFDSAVPKMVMAQYASHETPPEWWGKVRDAYLNGMNEMYRANTRARDGEAGRAYTLYCARRFEFGFEYMNCIESVRKAGIAKAKPDRETQLAELEKAVESMDAALNALAAVARSSSDRGIIAVLNEYGYRPLKRELEAVEKGAK